VIASRAALEQRFRPRRLRRNAAIRGLVREHGVRVEQLIQPLFIVEDESAAGEVSSMPQIFRYTVDGVVREVRALAALGVKSVLLFGIPSFKDATASRNDDPQGVVPRAARAIKNALPDVLVIADLCNCEYTDHGHCGVLSETTGRLDLDNDATLPLLAKQCVSHVQAGADLVAPSGMLDGMVGAIRTALDTAGFAHVPIMSYSAKYASGFYGPFRDAAESPPQFGDRNSYQMDPANSDEAIR